MLNSIRKERTGFTIVEVLIVLAIAGLILLIVFLAVPAVQRGSRNTARKSDAGNIYTAFNRFVNNNYAMMPVGASGKTTGMLTFCYSGGRLFTSASTVGTALACNLANNTTGTKIGFYLPQNIWLRVASSGSYGAPTVTTPGNETSVRVSIDSIIIEENQSCGDKNTGVLGGRSIAIWYVTESGRGNGALQCVGS